MAIVAVSLLLAGASGTRAQVGARLIDPVVRVGRDSTQVIWVHLQNSQTQTVYLGGFGSDLPASLLAVDGFAAYAAAGPESLRIGEAWEGELLRLTPAHDAPIGTTSHSITLLGGPPGVGMDVISQLLLRVEVYDATCAPAIVVQPQAAAVDSNETTSFTVNVADPEQQEFQWRHNGFPVIDNGRITGSLTATLTIQATQGTDAGAYDVVVANECGETTSTPAPLVVSGVVSVPGPPPPRILELAPPRPNPARRSVTLAWTLPAPGFVHLEVLDVAGRHIRTLVDGMQDVGPGRSRWDGSADSGPPAAPGVYFVRMNAMGRLLVRRFVLLQ